MADKLSLYSKKVMEHFQHPRNVGEMKNPDGIGHVGNPICGDIMELYIKVKNNKIIDAKFKTFGCLPSKEEVVLSEGAWSRISSILEGTDVRNINGEKTTVVQTYRTNHTRSLLKITPFVSPLNSFYVTPDHPILCIKRKWLKTARRSSQRCDWLRVNKQELLSTEPDYVKAQDLARSDYLIFVVNHEIKDNELFSKGLLRLVGYYLAEGYITANGAVVNFSFNKEETELIQEVKSLISEVMFKEAKQRTRDNVTEVRVCSKRWANFFCSVAGKLARKKKLSSEIMFLPFYKQWEMLKCYLKGDGDSYRRRSRDSQTYRATTVSRNLAIQIQEILARGGTFTSIREIFKTGCRIEGRKLKDSIQYIISFKLKRKHNFVHTNGKYFLVPIRKIEKGNFDGLVYNFQVMDEPNSYLVKGFAVHNCGAAIATSSMITEMVKGKTIEEALKISNKAVVEALDGLPPVKMHCSVLAKDALKSAIDDYLAKKSKKMVG